ANGGGTDAYYVSAPGGIAVDTSGGLYVADTSNNRILYFPPGGFTASIVYGQPDFISSGPGTSATQFTGPRDIALDAQNALYVSDTGNNRVLYFAPGSTTASRVWGQGA